MASSLDIFKENYSDISEMECEHPVECRFSLDLKGHWNHEAV